MPLRHQVASWSLRVPSVLLSYHTWERMHRSDVCSTSTCSKATIPYEGLLLYMHPSPTIECISVIKLDDSTRRLLFLTQKCKSRAQKHAKTPPNPTKGPRMGLRCSGGFLKNAKSRERRQRRQRGRRRRRANRRRPAPTGADSHRRRITTSKHSAQPTVDEAQSSAMSGGLVGCCGKHGSAQIRREERAASRSRSNSST